MKVALSVVDVLVAQTMLDLRCMDQMYLNLYVPVLQMGMSRFFRTIRVYDDAKYHQSINCIL